MTRMLILVVISFFTLGCDSTMTEEERKAIEDLKSELSTAEREKFGCLDESMLVTIYRLANPDSDCTKNLSKWASSPAVSERRGSIETSGNSSFPEPADDGEAQEADEQEVRPLCEPSRSWSIGGTPDCVNGEAGAFRKRLSEPNRGCYIASARYSRMLDIMERTLFLRQHRACVTYPYLGDLYDFDNGVENARIKNQVHAGLDFRGNGQSVRAGFGGCVVARSYDKGKGHSTLTIETHDNRYRVAFLHMQVHDDMTVGTEVTPRSIVGTIGSVGTVAPHLHIEVWSSNEQNYSRTRAVWGCGRGKCSLDNVADMTIDPAVFFAEQDGDVSWKGEKACG